MGYDRLLVFATGTGLERGARMYWIEGDWFGDGSDTALARYLHACPVNRHVLDSTAPFFWSKRQGVRGERYQVVKQPRDVACMGCGFRCSADRSGGCGRFRRHLD